MGGIGTWAKSQAITTTAGFYASKDIRMSSTRKALEEFWRQFFRWDTDTVADIGMGAVWYFFASWSQAATAMAMLVNHFDDVLVVAYSIDPCGDSAFLGAYLVYCCDSRC